MVVKVVWLFDAGGVVVVMELTWLFGGGGVVVVVVKNMW